MPSKVKALLIDDDHGFGQIMTTIARLFDVDLSYTASLDDLGSVGRLQEFDFIICDFFLEVLRGSDVADYVNAFFINKPMVIISGDPNVKQTRKNWPKCIKGFLTKRGRPDAILQQALSLAGYSRCI